MTWSNITRPNKHAKMPYGYIPSEEDPCILIPDPDMIPLIEEGMDYLDQGFSTRKVSEWLTEKTGKSITHQGINNIWRRHRGETSPRIKELEKRAKKRRPKTAKDKRIAETKRKTSDLKRVLTMQEKKLEKLDPKTAASDSLDFNVVDEHKQNQEVVFAPNPGPQTEFLAASEREVLYGGSAGGGKSYGLLADPMRYFGNGNFNGIILRRTNDELRELIWKSQEMYPKAYPGAKWQEKKSQWVFPSGAKLWMTYLERDEDVLRYQGQAFSYIAFDELTQHSTPFSWNYMRSRLRTTDQSLPLFMRATTNPGGPGHMWVKQMFIDPAPAGKKFAATNIETGEDLVYPDGHDKEGQPLFMRRFIPASLKDNP